MEAAIANAEKLEKINAGKLPSDSAPGTKIHVLVKTKALSQIVTLSKTPCHFCDSQIWQGVRIFHLILF